METSFLFIFSLSGYSSRGISFHQTFHLFHSHLIEVTVYGIFSMQMRQEQIPVLSGHCRDM